MEINKNTTVKDVIDYLNNYLNEQNKTNIVLLYDFVYEILLDTFPFNSITIGKGNKQFTLYNQMTFKISTTKNKLGKTHNPSWSKEQLIMTTKSIDNINNYDLNVTLESLKNKSLNELKEIQQKQIDNFINLIQSKNISIKSAKEIINAYMNLPQNIKNQIF